MLKWTATLVGILLLFNEARTQGCSDAGFCTMGAMKPDQPYNKKIPIRLRSMEVSFYRGTTTLSPVVYVATADMSFNIIDAKTSMQVKVPFQAVSGNFGNTSGLGDLSVCFTRNIVSRETFDVNVSLGGKIASGDANKQFYSEQNGLISYPMYYQISLGTHDVIAGGSLITRDWLFAAGVQIPVVNNNKNEFTWGSWENVYKEGDGVAYVRGYSRCYNLERGIDVMLRVERNFRFSQLNFSVGLLPIYRVTRDEITIGSVRVQPDDAQGLALSAIGTVGYNFNVRSGVKLLIGHKLVQRDNNPDGLTRELVNTVSYYYRF